MTSNRPLGTGHTVKYDDISLRYLKWNIASAPNRTYASFKISRPLQGREQLDFSHGPDQDQCRHFLRSYWPRNSPGKGVQKHNGPQTNNKQWGVLILKHFSAIEFGSTRNQAT
jgi:hypothetical protein